MKRNRVIELLPVLTAFANGKTIQYYDDNMMDWFDTFEPSLHPSTQYRIKPVEPKINDILVNNVGTYFRILGEWNQFWIIYHKDPIPGSIRYLIDKKTMKASETGSVFKLKEK